MTIDNNLKVHNLNTGKTKKDVVTTVDRAIEIEALKAKFCGYIPEGETPGETDFNIFSYAYKKGMEHYNNYPQAK